jgi:OOP family OmpA-OmpF porin
MKNVLMLLIMTIILLPNNSADAQLWKRLKEKAEKRVEKNLEEKMEEKIDETMDGEKDEEKKENTESTQTNSRQTVTDSDELDYRNVYPKDAEQEVNTEIEISWELDIPKDMGFEHYEVYLSDNQDNLNESLIRAPQKPPFKYSELEPNKTYYWKIIAIGSKYPFPSRVYSFTTVNKGQLTWSKYDFVPGDEIIFDDMPSADEENGEFPSRWDLVKGQVEIAKFNGETVMMFIDGNPEIVPYMKDAKEDYLPDVFTIEFDVYKPGSSNRISLNLYDTKNQRVEKNQEIEISYNYIDIGDIRGTYPEDIDPEKGRWIHISIAYTKGKLKMYMDDTRLINIPRYQGNPTGFSIQCYWADAEHLYYLKNVRIAKGGVKYYDRVLNEGKIVTHGIKFDVGKALVKPESMGVINNIFEIMQENPEINFSVEGHTDSDGADALNMSLSEERALAVMNKLIEMGIDAGRLKYKGLGESVPMSDNSTAEGKAQNRRVEFVKF